MTQEQCFQFFEIQDLTDLPEAVMKLISLDLELRNERYIELLKINHHKMDVDWFQGVYEEELAQRKQNKQDFTPRSVSEIASRLTGNPNSWIYEPTAGNGSMLITDWWQRCLKAPTPWEFYPSQNMVCCWELSHRSIPILLLNLSIRGIMGYVFHGDVLTQEITAKYILLNRENSSVSFSEIIKDEENKLWIEGTTLEGNNELLKPFKNYY